MNMVKQTIFIRCQLENDIADKFADIKKELGLKNSSEVIRYLIRNH